MWRPAELDELVPQLRDTVCSELGWDAARWDSERERLALDVEGWTVGGIALAPPDRRAFMPGDPHGE